MSTSLFGHKTVYFDVSAGLPGHEMVYVDVSVGLSGHEMAEFYVSAGVSGYSMGELFVSTAMSAPRLSGMASALPDALFPLPRFPKIAHATTNCPTCPSSNGTPSKNMMWDSRFPKAAKTAWKTPPSCPKIYPNNRVFINAL